MITHNFIFSLQESFFTFLLQYNYIKLSINIYSVRAPCIKQLNECEHIEKILTYYRIKNIKINFRLVSITCVIFIICNTSQE